MDLPIIDIGTRIFIDCDCFFETPHNKAAKANGDSVTLRINATFAAVVINTMQRFPTVSFETFSVYDDELAEERLSYLLHTFPKVFFMVLIPSSVKDIRDHFDQNRDILITTQVIEGIPDKRQEKFRPGQYSFNDASKLQTRIRNRIMKKKI